MIKDDCNLLSKVDMNVQVSVFDMGTPPYVSIFGVSYIILIAGLLNVRVIELDNYAKRVKDSGLRIWHLRPIIFLASKIRTFYASF